MRAISIKQPWAERIASGAKRIEYRSWWAPSIVGTDLLIVASKGVMPGYRGEPLGVAVCVVLVVKMSGEPGDREWHVTNPRRVTPFAVRGYAGLYMVPDQKIGFAKPKPGARSVKSRRVANGPYTFSIGDRDLRGQRAKTPEAARRLARSLAAEHGVTITISRDGIAISGEG